jgi:hypothetical protein
MGKSTISMAIFNSKLLVYQRVLVLDWESHGWEVLPISIIYMTPQRFGSTAANHRGFPKGDDLHTEHVLSSPFWGGWVQWKIYPHAKEDNQIFGGSPRKPRLGSGSDRHTEWIWIKMDQWWCVSVSWLPGSTLGDENHLSEDLGAKTSVMTFGSTNGGWTPWCGWCHPLMVSRGFTYT